MKAKRAAGFVGLGLLLALSLYHATISGHASRAHGFVDFPIFVQRAVEFLETGVLYPNPTNLDYYEAGAPVYKFPPLFATCILPFVKNGVPPELYRNYWGLQVVLFVLTTVVAWLVFFRDQRRLALAFGLVVLAVNFEPFYETLWRLQLEIPMLLLLTLFLGLILRGQESVAGFLLGICVMLKIYPAFLLAYLLVTRRWRAIGWCGAAIVLLGASSWIIIGAQQSQAYFFQILPALMREAPVVNPENVGVARYAQSLLGAGPRLAKLLTQGVSLALLAISMLAIHRRESRGSSPDLRAMEFTLFIPLMLLALPNSWVNYQLLLLLPVWALWAHVLTGRVGISIPAVAGAAYLLLLFYQPCPDLSLGWPCSATPSFLGLGQLPRGLHDAFVDLRGLSSLLIWGATLAALRSSGPQDSPPEPYAPGTEVGR